MRSQFELPRGYSRQVRQRLLTVSSNQPPRKHCGNPIWCGTANSPVPFVLSGSDVDNDPLSYIIATQPKPGWLSVDSAKVTYRPPVDFVGAVELKYRAWDGVSYSNEATVTITVDPAPEPPAP